MNQPLKTLNLRKETVRNLSSQQSMYFQAGTGELISQFSVGVAKTIGEAVGRDLGGRLVAASYSVGITGEVTPPATVVTVGTVVTAGSIVLMTANHSDPCIGPFSVGQPGTFQGKF